MDPAYQHQIEAGEKLQKHDVYALLMEQGTGKSRPIIRDWLKRIHQGRADDLVVIGPKGAYMNWIGTPDEPGEIIKWVEPERLAGIQYVPWISGARSAERKTLNDLLFATRPRFLCMNIEAFNRPGDARDYLFKFIDGRKVIGTIDESTTICHEDAARTTWILNELAHKFVARRILSGLVAPESPMNLYTQYKYLDWRIIGQRSFFGFRNRYAVLQKTAMTHAHHQMEARALALEAKGDKAGANALKRKIPTVVLNYRNLEELHDKIMQYSYRRTKDECLDLPPKIYAPPYQIEMTDQQARIYRQMQNIAMAELEAGKFTTATIKLDQLGKLQHILCGHVRQDDGSLFDIPENRTDAVVEILQAHSGKAIVWAPYPQALRKIVARLQKEFGEQSTVGYWGATGFEERLDVRSRIQNDDACRFIVSNQSVGKFGNTWTACNLVIYYANSFDNEDRQQSEDRPHRIGQTKSVTYIDLRCKGTVDDKLVHVLRKKMSIAATLQGDKFKDWLM